MRTLHDFLGDKKGNYTLISVAVLTPVLLSVGHMLDQAYLEKKRDQLQGAVDGAALTVVREGVDVPAEKAEALARDAVAANFDAKKMIVGVKQEETTVTVSAAAEQKLAFGGLYGAETTWIRSRATAAAMPAAYQIGLVLDTTGSMEGAKLTAMRNAVHDMIDAMSAQVTHSQNLSIAVVPFAGFVNVGPQHGPELGLGGHIKKPAASWIDQKALAPIPQTDLPSDMSRFALYKHLRTEWPGCVETRMPGATGAHDVDDTIPTEKDPSTLFTPSFAIDEPDDPYVYPNSYLIDGTASAVSGTQADKLRRYGAPVTAKKPTNFIEWLIYIFSWRRVTVDNSPSYFYSNEADPKGPGYDCEIEPLLPLTNNLTTVKKKVDALKANGSTNMLEGVMWGWRVLSDRAPFTEGSSKKGNSVRKIMIFLSDGANSFGNLPNKLGSGYSSMGYLVDGRLDGLVAGSETETNAVLNKKTLQACQNAKADGIEIFTIRLEEDDKATGTLLQQCASSTDHYFDAPTKDQLKPVFEGIRDKLVSVRLTK